MATIFDKNVCDTLSNNMKLMLINADNNAALNLQEETIFYPKFQSMAAMYLYICCKMTPIKYLGALTTRVIKYESFGNVTPAYITYFKSCNLHWFSGFHYVPQSQIFYIASHKNIINLIDIWSVLRLERSNQSRKLKPWHFRFLLF